MHKNNITDRFLAIVMSPLVRGEATPDAMKTIEHDVKLVRDACHHVIMSPLYTQSQRIVALRRLCELDGEPDATVNDQDVLEYQQNSATSYLADE